MDTMESVDTSQRPTVPSKISWFEFLLHPSLLEEHLRKNNPDPSASQLIALFLYQADVAAATARDIKDESEGAGLAENKKKIRALKLLALKVSASLQWNLDVLNASVPLAMVQDVLLELLKLTLTDEEADPAKHDTLDFQTLPESPLFAVQLYHRWCLKVILEDSFPSKPSKTQAVQVPGLEIPVLNSANGKDTVMTIVKEGLATSISVLEKCMCEPRHMLMPTFKSLGFLHHESTVNTCWEDSIRVPSQELSLQLSYDLGSIKFTMQLYEEALKWFTQTADTLSQVESSSYHQVDRDVLSGYNMACRSMCAQPSTPQTLYDRLEATKKNNTKDVVDVLLEDNQSRQLSLVYRDSVEEFVLANHGRGSVHQEVYLCNVVRRAIEGKSMSSECERLLATNKHNIRFTLRCVNVTNQNLSHSNKVHLKTFLRYLCYKLPTDTRFVSSVLEPPIRSLLTSDDVQELSLLAENSSTERKLSVPENCSTEQQVMERQLLTSYEPTVIKDLVQKLLSKTSKTSIITLSDEWKIPRELSHPIENLPIPWVQVYCHLLVGKARVCLKLQLYDRAKCLLQAADTTIKDISYKLAKALRWELLKLDLEQQQATGSLSGRTTRSDVAKRAKACISISLEAKKDKDLQPGGELVASSVAFLFNSKEWDYLLSLNNASNGYIQLCRILVNVCKNFEMTNMAGNYSQQISSSRKVARDLWETVTLIFTSTSQQKRTGTGAMTTVQRESNAGILPSLAFINYMKKIKDDTAVSAMLSCLVKLYSMLKSEVNNDIHNEYVALWPSALPNVSAIMLNSVTDALHTVLQHTQSLDVVLPSWLRTRADFCFANGEFTHAMKHYLELFVLWTDYFSDGGSRKVYDETIIKRMIKCCSMLQCHTQVAVLCQCLDDIDYSTAFKALQESNTEDAMDTYYPFFWDSTMLEYIINLHHRQGHTAKKNLAIKAIGKFEVNCSNPTEILFEAAKVRKANFFRTLVKQYM